MLFFKHCIIFIFMKQFITNHPEASILNAMHQELRELNNRLSLQKPVLNLDEASVLTGISKSYLYKLTSTGGIPCYKPQGKRLYFKRVELEDWMLSNRKATTEEIDAAATSYVMFTKGGAR